MQKPGRMSVIRTSHEMFCLMMKLLGCWGFFLLFSPKHTLFFFCFSIFLYTGQFNEPSHRFWHKPNLNYLQFVEVIDSIMEELALLFFFFLKNILDN